MSDIPKNIPLVSVWNFDLVLHRFLLEAECGFGVRNVLPPLSFSSEDVNDDEVKNAKEADEEVGKAPKTLLSFKVCLFLFIIILYPSAHSMWVSKCLIVVCVYAVHYGMFFTN